MSAVDLPPRTTVSGVHELLYLREQIDVFTARRIEVASHIAEDAGFMGGKVLRIRHFEARRLRDLPLGSLVHVGSFVCEGTETFDDYVAHPADDCPVQGREGLPRRRRRKTWCERPLNEKVRAPYTREPNRSWHTNLGMWMVIGHDHIEKTATLVAIGDAGTARPVL